MRGILFWGPYKKDPTISGTILRLSIFGNSEISSICWKEHGPAISFIRQDGLIKAISPKGTTQTKPSLTLSPHPNFEILGAIVEKT